MMDFADQDALRDLVTGAHRFVSAKVRKKSK
jgi:hypothetical protein